MQAQQRYRERRKQKFQEMEQALEQLQSQVQDMHAVQSSNAALQVWSMPEASTLHTMLS